MVRKNTYYKNGIANSAGENKLQSKLPSKSNLIVGDVFRLLMRLMKKFAFIVTRCVHVLASPRKYFGSLVF